MRCLTIYPFLQAVSLIDLRVFFLVDKTPGTDLLLDESRAGRRAVRFDVGTGRGGKGRRKDTC